MSVTEYENVEQKLDRSKTWINIKYRKIFSREIIYKEYYSINKRFNKDLNEYEYYLITYDVPPLNQKVYKTYVDNWGRKKYWVDSIWNESNIQYYNKDTNIEVKIVEKADTYIVYKLYL